MYIINPTTKITAIAASTEDASYPKENVEDDFRTNYWLSTASPATLTLSVSTGASAVGIAYTNATTVRVQSTDPVFDHTYTIDSGHPNVFAYYGVSSGAHTVTLTFTNAKADPYCGIVRCSNVYTFDNPEYGLQEGLKDYSVSKRYNNGALYYLQRNIVRTFSGNILVDRDTEFWVFLHTIAKAQGLSPMFWQVTDTDAEDWAIFAELEDMPGGSHDYPEHSKMSFSLVEAI